MKNDIRVYIDTIPYLTKPSADEIFEIEKRITNNEYIIKDISDLISMRDKIGKQGYSYYSKNIISLDFNNADTKIKYMGYDTFESKCSANGLYPLLTYETLNSKLLPLGNLFPIRFRALFLFENCLNDDDYNIISQYLYSLFPQAESPRKLYLGGKKIINFSQNDIINYDRYQSLLQCAVNAIKLPKIIPTEHNSIVKYDEDYFPDFKDNSDELKSYVLKYCKMVEELLKDDESTDNSSINMQKDICLDNLDVHINEPKEKNENKQKKNIHKQPYLPSLPSVKSDTIKYKGVSKYKMTKKGQCYKAQVKNGRKVVTLKYGYDAKILHDDYIVPYYNNIHIGYYKTLSKNIHDTIVPMLNEDIFIDIIKEKYKELLKEISNERVKRTIISNVKEQNTIQQLGQYTWNLIHQLEGNKVIKSL